MVWIKRELLRRLRTRPPLQEDATFSHRDV